MENFKENHGRKCSEDQLLVPQFSQQATKEPLRPEHAKLSLRDQICRPKKFLNRKNSLCAPISIKKSFFSMKKINKQQQNEILDPILQKIQSKRFYQLQSAKSSIKHISKELKEDENKVDMPRNIVDILYRQNIKNYNPFVSTLNQLQQEDSMSYIEKKKVSDICHIGAAKAFIKAKKFSGGPKYNRVNILIRPYMRDKMEQEVKQMQQKYQNVVFIPTNQLALSFSSSNYPNELAQVIPQKVYFEVIQHVNTLISNQYVRYKQSNLPVSSQSLTGKVIIMLIALCCLFFPLSRNPALLISALVLILIWIGYSVFECSQRLSRLVQSKDVTSIILQKITQFFESIKTDQFEWRIGEDFYWIEIHFIRKSKRFQLPTNIFRA